MKTSSVKEFEALKSKLRNADWRVTPTWSDLQKAIDIIKEQEEEIETQKSVTNFWKYHDQGGPY